MFGLLTAWSRSKAECGVNKEHCSDCHSGLRDYEILKKNDMKGILHTSFSTLVHCYFTPFTKLQIALRWNMMMY